MLKSCCFLKSLCVIFGIVVLSGCDDVARLSKNGISDYVIVISRDASDDVKFAAFDLKRHLDRVTGADFKLGRSGDAGLERARTIEVGTKAAIEAIGEERVKGLGHNGSIVACRDGRIYIAGKDKFGTAYGVYDFLEKKVGCRWYTGYGDELIPSKPELKFEPFEISSSPALDYRWILLLDNTCRRVRNGALFEYRNKLNVIGGKEYTNVDLPEGCGKLVPETWQQGSYCHTMFWYMPPDGGRGMPPYFKLHPEWFSYVKKGDGGERVKTKQVCFTNPGLRAEYRRLFLDYVKKSGGKGVYSISARDIPGRFCECDACLAIEKKYGTPGAPLFDFMRETCEELGKRHPEALLSTLAYRKNQTQIPPNDAFPGFPDNFLVVFAPIDDDFSKDFSHTNNAATLEDLRVWCRKAKHVWPWYYPQPYSTYSPYSGVRRMAEDTRMMVEAGITGASYEHDWGTDIGCNFFDLHCWVLTKLYCDPTLDAMALAKDFCRGYYGAAAEGMYGYLCELENLREGYPRSLRWDKYMCEIFTPERVVRWNAAFDGMEELVKDDERVLQRVRETRLGLEEMTFRCYARLRAASKEFSAAPEEIYSRVTNTIVNALVRRGVEREEAVKHKFIKSYEFKFMAAGASVNMKPAEFSHLPDDKVRQAFTVRPVTGARRKPMADACLGTAAWYDKEPLRKGRDFDTWVWDGTHRKSLARNPIPNSELVHGKFHLYKIASDVPLAPECCAVVGESWHIMTVMDDLYASDDERWDVYLSLKFEGEHYFPERKGEKNRVSFDRVVVVPPGSIPQTKEKRK